MKEIEITEENVEMYQKFYDVKTDRQEIKHLGLFTVVASIGALLVFGIIGSGFLGYMMILKHIITTLGITLANTNAWIFSSLPQFLLYLILEL